MQLLVRHWQHHSRFYVALLLALVAYPFAKYAGVPKAPELCGDIFFGSYLVASFFLGTRLTPELLDRRADIEDEGAILVFVITLAAIVFASTGVFTAINQVHAPRTLPLVIALAGAPLAWFMLHTVSAFRYAYLYYSTLPAVDGSGPALKFPGEGHPGIWDFAYFSFVIGMTAQVSDVQVCSKPMRQAALVHGIVSFFFNTVLIAMAVSVVVARGT